MELKLDENKNVVGFEPTEEGILAVLELIEKEYENIDLYSEEDILKIDDTYSLEVVYDDTDMNDVEVVLALKENGEVKSYWKFFGYYSSYDGRQMDWDSTRTTEPYEKVVTFWK